MSNYQPSLFYGQNDTQCFLCGSRQYINRHEIFFGSAYRKKSQRYGLWVNVCMSCHDKIHFGKDHSLDEHLKKQGQKRFEEFFSREKFMEEFGKNRL